MTPPDPTDETTMNPSKTPLPYGRLVKARWLFNRATDIVIEEARRQGRPLRWRLDSTKPPSSSRCDALDEAWSAASTAADRLERRVVWTLESFPEPQRPVTPKRPEPVETVDTSKYEDDSPPRFVVNGDFGRFDPGMAGIEPSILGRIWNAREITARLAAAGQLGDLPRLHDCLIRPTWGASRYVAELEPETETECRAVAQVCVEHHRSCPVSAHGTGCRCVFLVTITIGEREWSVSEDGSLTPVPKMPIRFGSVRRYRPGQSDLGRGLPEFSDVVRKRGLVYWDRQGIAYVPDFFQIVFLGDLASELIPNPLPTAVDDE